MHAHTNQIMELKKNNYRLKKQRDKLKRQFKENAVRQGKPNEGTQGIQGVENSLEKEKGNIRTTEKAKLGKDRKICRWSKY